MGLTVVVVLVVLAVIAAVAILAVQGRRRRQEQQRIEAAEHRREAEIRTASAQRREAEAAERAARAEREQAQAREQAARANQDREVAQARQAAADRIDPDRSRRDDPADPAARTDDLRVPGGAGHDRPQADQREAEPSGRPETAANSGQHAAFAGHHTGSGDGPPGPAGPPAGGHAGPTGQHARPEPDMAARPDGPAGQGRGAGAGEATTGPIEQAGERARPAGSPQRDGQGPDADPAARTDDLALGRGSGGRHEAPGAEKQPDGDPLTAAWHGPTATGGSAGANRDGRHAEATDGEAPADVPAQRTGGHERHGVRALADRLLGRND